MRKKNIPNISLKRSLSFALVFFYGLGTILGAGIYALVGKVGVAAGIYTPLAFLIAAVIAFFTAMSYAELGSRFPRSAGVAYYVNMAFHRKYLTGLMGWLVVFTGLISAAALTRAFVGYLHLFIALSPWISILGLTVILGGLAIWGIIESVVAIMIITLIEVAGLLFVIFIGGDSLKSLPNLWKPIILVDVKNWIGIFSGAFIAFYAYIGFEDMANIAEEIKNPKKTLPYAIFAAFGISTILYFLVALIAVLAVPLNDLTQSEAPLALIFESRGYSPILIGLISLIAIINGVLVQIIMASRLLFGMAKLKNAPRWFAKVHPKTQTPIIATLFILVIILVLALWFPVETLAKATSAVILCVFIMVNVSLILIKLKGSIPADVISYPIIIPMIGAILSILFLGVQIF